jgi:hypothetical protein
MDFFRKNQKIIILAVVVSFIIWTVGAALLPLILK